MFAKDTLPSTLIKNSFGDGIFATVFAILTSGVFRSGIAIYLGMNEFAIGLMAAIPYDRIVAVGYGSMRPLASNQTAEGRAINRRINAFVKPWRQGSQ